MLSDNAIIGIIMGSFGVLTWLLGLSYFLGRNTAKLDGLADQQEKMDATVTRIFDELKALRAIIPHVCDKTESITQIRTTQHEVLRRIDSIEHWRNEESIRIARILERDYGNATQDILDQKIPAHP